MEQHNRKSKSLARTISRTISYSFLLVLLVICFSIAILRCFPHNIRAIIAKIKLLKNPHSMVTFGIKVRRSYRDLSSETDPAREN